MSARYGNYIAMFWFLFLFSVFIGIFWVGIYHNFALTDQQVKFWDLALKGIGGLVAVSGAAIAVMKYIDEQSKSNEAALIEARKPFMTKRQEVYYELVSATAVLSTEAKDDDEWLRCESIFWKLYWGALPLVADQLVGQATNKFENALLNDEMEEEEQYVAMRNASMDLAKACRFSLGFGS